MVNDPVSAPVTVGVNPAYTVQVAPAVSVAPQVLRARNDVGLVPPNVMESSSTTAVPEFVSVTICIAELLPTFTVPNASVVALSFSTGTAVPDPVKVTFCGDPVALSVIVKVPLSAPEAVGLKLTYRLHEAPAANVAPQVCNCSNELAFVPVIAIELIVAVIVPGLLSVTTCRSLVLPTAVAGNASDATLNPSEPGATPVPVMATS